LIVPQGNTTGQQRALREEWPTARGAQPRRRWERAGGSKRGAPATRAGQPSQAQAQAQLRRVCAQMLTLCSLAQPDRSDWNEVIDLATAEPLSCACVDRYGWSPLFLALYNSAPELAIIALIDARPSSVFAQTPFCDNAFHLAARYDASAVVICALAEAATCPDLTASLNANGQSALHVAAELGAGCEALVALIEAAPTTPLLTTRQGTALHIAIKHQAEEDEIATLVEYGPEAVTMVDSAWRSPLHIALRAGSPPAVVKLLCDANAAVAAMCDKFGSSPLHTAISRRQAGERTEEDLVEIVSLLLASSPASRGASDSSGCTPYDIALANKASAAVLALLRQRGKLAPLGADAQEADEKEGSEAAEGGEAVVTGALRRGDGEEEPPNEPDADGAGGDQCEEDRDEPFVSSAFEGDGEEEAAEEEEAEEAEVEEAEEVEEEEEEAEMVPGAPPLPSSPSSPPPAPAVDARAA
jgi:ankyrin repeat protein